MAPAFPALDHDGSPYTGWTRAHWVYLLARMTYGYVRAAQRSGSPARALFPHDRRGLPDAVDALEAFARIASAWGAWLRNPANPATLEFDGFQMDLESLLREALLQGTDPSNPSTYWGDIGHLDQRIVECADIAVALWMSRERVFGRMNAAEQEQIMRWLAQVDGKGTFADNWILFTAMTQAVRHHLGFPAPLDDLDDRLLQVDEFYRGDGWYVDGLDREFELYNAWMFGWHYLLWTWIDGARRPDLRQRVLERGRSFLEGFLHFFGANGSFPAWGRSVVYRFAAIAPFAVGYFLKIAPGDPGLLRRVSSGCIRYFYEQGLFDPEDHFVRQGYHGEFPAAGEAYISPGSPYWCCHGLFALTLDQEDPFWTALESPLPVERGDYELALPAPGFLVSGRSATGQVLLLNGRSGQEHDAPSHNYTSKYGKLAYSTHFPFNVLPVHGSFAPDAMICLTRDGHTFGHRLHTRAGAVAPGFLWSRFEEVLDDELQPVWVGVLLWRDLQIRLGVLRPTLPVMAYEAPGALGCMEASSIMRRSDQAEGWEYAQAEGRALAIQRLAGYDRQSRSAPFLGQSNINLAYAYTEQPLVYESRPSVHGRCLASVSLVRPRPFDPREEFAGIQVEAHLHEMIRVHLPDHSICLVAPGQTRIDRARLDDIEVRGDSLSYVRLSRDLDEAAGMGVTHVSGIADFETPATFALGRISPAEVRLRTSTGVSVSREWLGRDARSLQARGWDGEWLDVSRRSSATEIPTGLVQELAGCYQRTLVEFRIIL
jgi:hypothetical protein